MKSSTQILVLLLIGWTTSTLAQVKTETTEEKPYIEVVGKAEKEVIPDEIYIGITLREKYVNKEKVTIEAQETKLKDAIKAIGVDLKNLQLADAGADYVKIRWQKKDVLTTKDYTLKTADAATVTKVFQELDKLEITDAKISRVAYSKIDSLRKEIKIMAIKAAKDKANYLLSAIGETLGEPLVINEANQSGYSNTYSNSIVKGQSSGAYYLESVQIVGRTGIEDKEIEFQKIKEEASVYIKFSIK